MQLLQADAHAAAALWFSVPGNMDSFTAAPTNPAFHSQDHRRCSRCAAGGREGVSGRLCTDRSPACRTLCARGKCRRTSPWRCATFCRCRLDADDEGVVGFVTVTDGHTVDAPAAFFQGYVLLLGHDEGCVVTTALEMLDDCASNQAVVLVLPEASVRRAFARGFDPVAVVY